MDSNQEKEGILRRQKIGSQTYLALLVVSFGSITYGYSAAVIGNTLGEYIVWLKRRACADNVRSTIFHILHGT